jgi:hypothetical protein
MLCSCVLNFGPKWDKHLPLVEFSYNNSYQESIKMSPFKVLYGRPCRTQLSWSESGERVIFGPDIVIEVEDKVKQIHANILTYQSRQKSYIDKRHHPLEFEVGDHVYLWVSPMKCVHRFGIKGKLAPWYIGTYPIIDKYGPLSYQVELPSKLSGVYNVFHVSQLKRCLKSPTDVVVEDTIPLEPNLTYKSHPIKILDQQDESPEIRLPGFTRFNGMTTPRTKPCGNISTSYDPTTPSFFRQGNQYKPHPPLPSM